MYATYIRRAAPATTRWASGLLLLAALPASARAQGLSGTWSGGTNAAGRWYYAEAHLTGDAAGLRGSIDVVGAQAGGLRLEALEADGTLIRFTLRTALGVMRFEGTLRDDMIEGKITGGAPGATLHLMRTVVPPPQQADAAVGHYQLDRDEGLLVTYRPFGQLAVTVLVRQGGGEQIKRSLLAIPVGPDRYVTSGSIVQSLRRDETLALQRDAAGAVSGITWTVPEGSSRSARRVAGLRQRSVRFSGAAGSISGTLFLPEGRGPFPAVVLAGGSGPTTRDNILIRAREFTRLGLAALTWDKRGLGETAGDYQTAGFDDLADDAARALTFLRSQPDVDSKRVGMQGHSQGGWIAPLASARSTPPPSWLIVSSGGPILPGEQEAWRARTQALAGGASAEEAAAAEAFMRRKWRYAFTGDDWAGYETGARQAATAKWGGIVSPVLTTDSTAWAFMRALKGFDPMASVLELRMPVLVMFGGKDDEQPSVLSGTAWLDAFRRSGHTDHEIVTIPGAPHSLWIGPGDPRPILAAPTDAIGRWLSAHRFR